MHSKVYMDGVVTNVFLIISHLTLYNNKIYVLFLKPKLLKLILYFILILYLILLLIHYLINLKFLLWIFFKIRYFYFLNFEIFAVKKLLFIDWIIFLNNILIIGLKLHTFGIIHQYITNFIFNI